MIACGARAKDVSKVERVGRNVTSKACKGLAKAIDIGYGARLLKMMPVRSSVKERAAELSARPMEDLGDKGMAMY
jgi:hypothetical protein